MPPAHLIPDIRIPALIGPALAALLVIFLMSRLHEPVRHKINVVIVAGFSTIYVGGALGPWELLYMLPAAYVAYRAIDSQHFVALGWLMHPAWDLVHHFQGSPIWPWMPASSVGCAVFDTIVALWAFTVARGASRPLLPTT